MTGRLEQLEAAHNEYRNETLGTVAGVGADEPLPAIAPANTSRSPVGISPAALIGVEFPGITVGSAAATGNSSATAASLRG